MKFWPFPKTLFFTTKNCLFEKKNFGGPILNKNTSQKNSRGERASPRDLTCDLRGLDIKWKVFFLFDVAVFTQTQTKHIQKRLFKKEFFFCWRSLKLTGAIDCFQSIALFFSRLAFRRTFWKVWRKNFFEEKCTFFFCKKACLCCFKRLACCILRKSWPMFWKLHPWLLLPQMGIC